MPTTINLAYHDMVGLMTVQPSRKSSSNTIHSIYRYYKSNPWIQTAEAVAKGYAISLLDGPAPFMDFVGFWYATFDATKTWVDYFSR